jgi:hypothetical protein
VIIEPDFVDHWKTRLLVGLLADDELAPIYLIRLWAHCQQRKSSSFTSLPTAGIKAICHYQGSAETLEEALIGSGFVTRDGVALHVIGWDEYNASLIANWTNGSKGGRPKNNPPITHGLAMGSPSETHGVTDREDKSREDKKGKSKAEAAPPTALPDWMPLDSWAGYLEMRKKIKKAPTDRAVTLLIASLGKMLTDGQDITAVLDKSTKSNWTDVYPIRDCQQARAGPGAADRFDPTAYVNRNRNPK